MANSKTVRTTWSHSLAGSVSIMPTKSNSIHSKSTQAQHFWLITAIVCVKQGGFIKHDWKVTVLPQKRSEETFLLLVLPQGISMKIYFPCCEIISGVQPLIVWLLSTCSKFILNVRAVITTACACLTNARGRTVRCCLHEGGALGERDWDFRGLKSEKSE